MRRLVTVELRNEGNRVKRVIRTNGHTCTALVNFARGARSKLPETKFYLREFVTPTGGRELIRAQPELMGKMGRFLGGTFFKDVDERCNPWLLVDDGPIEVWLKSDEPLLRGLPWTTLVVDGRSLNQVNISLRVSNVTAGTDVDHADPVILWIGIPGGMKAGGAEGRDIGMARAIANTWWDAAGDGGQFLVARCREDVAQFLKCHPEIIIFCGSLELDQSEGRWSGRLSMSGPQSESFMLDQLRGWIREASVTEPNWTRPTLLHLDLECALPTYPPHEAFSDLAEVVTWGHSPTPEQEGSKRKRRGSRGADRIEGWTPGTAGVLKRGPVWFLWELLQAGRTPARAVKRVYADTGPITYGCSGKYRTWKAGTPQTGLRYLPSQRERLDRLAQVDSFSGMVARWLVRRPRKGYARNQPGTACVCVWTGGEMDGVDDLQRRLTRAIGELQPEENYNLGIFDCTPRWPGTRGCKGTPSEEAMLSELEENILQELRLTSLGGLSEIVQECLKEQDVDGGLIVFTSFVFEQNERPSEDELDIFLTWWADKYALKWPTSCGHILGLGFKVGNDKDREGLDALMSAKAFSSLKDKYDGLTFQRLAKLGKVEAEHVIDFIREEGLPSQWADLRGWQRHGEKGAKEKRAELRRRCEELVEKTGGDWRKLVARLSERISNDPK